MAEQICTRCVMDNSDPGIEFDENGVCSVCKQYMHNRELSGYHPGESEKKLQETVAMMKENSKGSDYDCVLGISGGVDSAYMAYLAHQLGLRVLAVHVDSGWNSEIAVRNIEKMCEKLNIQLHTYVMDWPTMKELTRAFMLSGLAKPVVLTGSQLPIGEIREDGTENLITALQIAAARTDAGEPMVQEVAISFGRHLWRGNRATKVSSTNFGAFQSFNYPPLADMDLHIVFRERLLARPATGGTLAAALAMDDAVSVVFLYPGITEAVLRPQLESKAVKALVLRTFGAGNAPTESWFTELMADTVRAGKVVVNVTQCPAGGVEEKRYATGDALARSGVVSGYDMTSPSSCTCSARASRRPRWPPPWLSPSPGR